MLAQQWLCQQKMHFTAISWRWMQKLFWESKKWLHLWMLNIWTLLFDIFHYMTAFDPNTGIKCWQFVSDMSLFFWWIRHQMSKKVDKQGQYLFWILGKWTSSCSFKRDIKIGVKINEYSTILLYISSKPL